MSYVFGKNPGEFPDSYHLRKACATGLRARVLYGLADKVRSLSFKGSERMANTLDRAAVPGRLSDDWAGIEPMRYPETSYLLEMLPWKPDLVHLHNLHGGYFDLQALEQLSREVPTVITLHDEWTFTGHCACTFGCDRWRLGCGSCPNLESYPRVLRDATDFNWNKKKAIYERCKVTVVTPSRWLLGRAKESILKEAAIRFCQIPNGIDTSNFAPGDRATARKALGLHPDHCVLLFAAFGLNTPAKDYSALEQALRELKPHAGPAPVTLLALGALPREKVDKSLPIVALPVQHDQKFVASCYHAADIYVHATKTDNFPTTILEAMACCLPTIATHVGGIPEQIVDGVTGILVPKGNSVALAAAIESLRGHPERRSKMGKAGWHRVVENFTNDHTAEKYGLCYDQAIKDWNASAKGPDPSVPSKR